MEFKDYYDTLGVSEDAPADEIKKTYRKLARKYHPDVSKEPDAETKFKDLGEAYEVLRDPGKRAEYDQLRQYGSGQSGEFEPPPGWSASSQFGGGGFTGADASQFSDFFGSIFGGKGGGGRRGGFDQSMRMQGDDVNARLALTLEEAFNGCEKQIRFDVTEVDDQGLPRKRVKTLNVKIPAGMAQGQAMRLRGQGSPGYNGAHHGDLFIEVNLKPHPIFTVEGRNVVMTLPVAPWEAALGETINIPTLGSRLNLKVPKGSTSGQKLRLKGKGFHGKQAGDLIAVLQIALPKSHSDTAEALYWQLAEAERDFDPRANLNREG
jgi:curved DNA-binding protein